MTQTAWHVSSTIDRMRTGARWERRTVRTIALLVVTLLLTLTPVRAIASSASFFQTPYDTVPNLAQNPTIRSRASGD